MSLTKRSSSIINRDENDQFFTNGTDISGTMVRLEIVSPFKASEKKGIGAENKIKS